MTGFFIVQGIISKSSWGCRCSCALVGSLRQSSVPGSSPKCRNRRKSCGPRRAAARRWSRDRVGPGKGFGQLLLQLRTDRVELFRAVQGDDTDLFICRVQHQRIRHLCSPPDKEAQITRGADGKDMDRTPMDRLRGADPRPHAALAQAACAAGSAVVLPLLEDLDGDSVFMLYRSPPAPPIRAHISGNEREVRRMMTSHFASS